MTDLFYALATVVGIAVVLKVVGAMARPGEPDRLPMVPPARAPAPAPVSTGRSLWGEERAEAMRAMYARQRNAPPSPKPKGFWMTMADELEGSNDRRTLSRGAEHWFYEQAQQRCNDRRT